MRPEKYQRFTQPTPEELTDACLIFLRRKFYSFPGGDRAFFQHRRDLLRRVVLWPASWLDGRGVTISGDAYREIFMRVFMQAASHVESKIKYPPAYLAQVLQSHFKIHGQDYYDAAKATRNQVDHVMLLAGQIARQPSPATDPIRAMNEARQILVAGSKKKRAEKTSFKSQMNLFC